MTTEEFVTQLRRPMYNFNMADHTDEQMKDWHPALAKSCRTRREDALTQIHQLALEYVNNLERVK